MKNSWSSIKLLVLLLAGWLSVQAACRQASVPPAPAAEKSKAQQGTSPAPGTRGAQSTPTIGPDKAVPMGAAPNQAAIDSLKSVNEKKGKKGGGK